MDDAKRAREYLAAMRDRLDRRSMARVAFPIQNHAGRILVYSITSPGDDELNERTRQADASHREFLAIADQIKPALIALRQIEPSGVSVLDWAWRTVHEHSVTPADHPYRTVAMALDILLSSKPESSDRWITLTEAEQLTAVNRGTISRAADAGHIIDNGKSGRDRRIDLASLQRWNKARANNDDL